MDDIDKIERLENALDAEEITAVCCDHLASLIKNGRIKKNFVSFSEAAKNNQRLLRDRLVNLGTKGFVSKDKCKFCRISPESFSLSGAINLGLEVTGAAIKFYKDLLTFSQTEDDKELFRSLIQEKNRNLNFFKKEKKFVRPEEDKVSIIDTYCISGIISQLWK